MKAIFTTYRPATDTKGSRVRATDDDGNVATVGYDNVLNSEGNHKAAVLALCRKMGWTGELIAGDAGAGRMVFVWNSDLAPRKVIA